MWFLWILGFIVWNIVGGGICIAIMVDKYEDGSEEFNCDKLNPIYIYKNTNCNTFGVICLAMLINILCPILTICYWVYKLCTVGRKYHD